MTSNLVRAHLYIDTWFRDFAGHVIEQDREEFFDPRNRDLWIREFSNYLKSKIDLASND